MNGLIIEPNGKIYIKEFQEPLHRSAGEIVGGLIEIVKPRRLGYPYVMIVNEEFLLLQLPYNPVGSWLYCTDEHGHPICGNILILKEEGENLTSIDPEELQWLKSFMKFIYKSVK